MIMENTEKKQIKMSVEEILAKKSFFEEEQAKNERLKGQTETMMQQLESEFNCCSIDEAEKLLKKLEEEEEEYRKKSESLVEIINEKMNHA